MLHLSVRRALFTFIVFVAGATVLAAHGRSAETATRLTTTGHDVAPVYSPDGHKIAFISYRFSDDGDLFVMNADGTAQTRLTDDATAASLAGWEGSYVWSPTGTQILFVAQHWIGDSLTLPDIFVVPADGSAPPVNLTNAPSEWHFQPQWSPDGTRIAFTTGFGIAVMNADASNAIQLTGGSDTSDSHPSWSPAGDRIAFQRLEGREQDGHIYVMNADGTGAVQLTNDSAFVDRFPLWSANGKSITFVRGAFGLSSSIFVMKLSDGTLTNISGTLPVDGPGVWSPDGRRVAFGSVNFFGAPGDIFAVNRHGSNLSNLTGTPTIFEFGPPSWSPNSKRIAFYVRDPEDWRRGDIFSIAVK